MAAEDKAQLESGDEEKDAGFKFDPKMGIPVILVQAVIAYFLASFVIVPTFFAPVNAEEALEEAAQDDGEFGVVYIVEDVIVNPAESGGSRYAVVNIAFEVKDDEAVAVLTTKDVKVRDLLIYSLGSRTIDQLDGPDDKELLRQEIQENVGKLLPKGHLKNVYFVNYILQ